jgi:hypothetical protein
MDLYGLGFKKLSSGRPIKLVSQDSSVLPLAGVRVQWLLLSLQGILEINQ